MRLFGKLLSALKSLVNKQDTKQSTRYAQALLSGIDSLKVPLNRRRRRAIFHHSSYYRGCPVLTGWRLVRTRKQGQQSRLVGGRA